MLQIATITALLISAYYQVNGFRGHRVVKKLITQRASNSDDRTVEAFETSWAQQNIGAKSLKHANFPWFCGNVRGLRATGPIAKGVDVAVVPLLRTLYVPESGMKACPPGIEEIWKDLKGTSRLSMLLLQEYGQGSGSSLSKYIEALPRPGSVGTPLYWPESFLDAFPYSPLVRSVTKQKQQWSTLYEKLKKTKQFSNVSYERFLWAMEMVRSRAFQGIGGISDATEGKANIKTISAIASSLLIGAALLTSRDLAYGETLPIVLGTLGALSVLPSVLKATESSCVLLPVIDSSNHRGTGAVCDINYDPARGAFVMQSLQPITKDEQVTISYGNRNNDELLQYFGFVEENCAFDRFIVDEPLAVLKQALTLESDITDSNAEVLKHRRASLLKSIDLAAASAVTASTSVAAGTGAATVANMLVLNKGEINTWNLDQLMLLSEEDAVPVNNQGKGTGNAENILKGDAFIRVCLRTILRAESQRLEASKAAFVVTSEASSGESNEAAARNCVSTLFLQEKISVLSSALDRLAKL